MIFILKMYFLTERIHLKYFLIKVIIKVNGLCTLVSFKGRIVISSLIPKLTYPTVNTKAFSTLAKVAGDILSRHIVSVLPALLQAVSNVIDKPNNQEDAEKYIIIKVNNIYIYI